MPVILVNDQYRITSNRSAWQVEKHRGVNEDGSDRWEPISYHIDFASSLNALAELRIRLIDASVPEEIMLALKEIRNEVAAAASLFGRLNV